MLREWKNLLTWVENRRRWELCLQSHTGGGDVGGKDMRENTDERQEGGKRKHDTRGHRRQIYNLLYNRDSC